MMIMSEELKDTISDLELELWLKSNRRQWLQIIKKANVKQKVDMIPYFSQTVLDIVHMLEKEDL